MCVCIPEVNQTPLFFVFHHCHFFSFISFSDRPHGLFLAIPSPPTSAVFSQYQLFDIIYRDQSAASQFCHCSVTKIPRWDSVVSVPGNTTHHKSFPICLQSFSSFSLSGGMDPIWSSSHTASPHHLVGHWWLAGEMYTKSKSNLLYMISSKLELQLY